ncbi:cytochrome C oxidase subunit IV family protein [uncultured Algibacter sp.]|uniref:cytochrome C oxidase subunit IV family protein n=1 Tax=uncultured Algibacter sp. TaxID=298659 RepID=UPI0030EC5832|tara:strand:+ start:46 stop:279 length:234 start_codon:yes stop_codon:yes gene_type:complete
MKNTATITWIILLVLTITSALVSKLESKYVVFIILILSALKFFGIAFQFMEIKKAHVFWKTIIIGSVFLFGMGLLVA